MKKTIIFISLVSLDQLLKYFAQKLPPANGFVKFVCNKDIAWSISIAPGFFYFIWIVIILLIIYLFLKSKSDSEKIALVLILSGAFSNLFDRLSRGCVIDFIDLKFWPVFNTADIYISIGVFSMLFLIIKNKRRETTGNF
jgi:signal peptidase II